MLLKKLKKVLKVYKHWSDYVVIGLLLSFIAFLVLIYSWRSDFKSDIFTDIRSPVQVDKQQYRVGEIVKGSFIGETFSKNKGEILRVMQCDRQRVSLTPIGIVSTPRVLNGTPIGIITIEKEATLAGVEIQPDTNCVIAFRSVYCGVFLGVPACNDNTRYYTDNFDIIE